MTKHEMIILSAADDVSRLRRSDVDRVVTEAAEQQILVPFTAWLMRKRPDLSAEISAALDEATAP